MRKYVIISAVILCIPGFGMAQKQVVLLPENSSITISGTSTLHDWEESIEKFDVNLELNFQDTKIAGVDKVEFKCQSASISSDYSIMTNKTLNALRAEKHPEIQFRMVSVEKFLIQQEKFSGILVGDLSVAGVTKRVRLEFSGHNGGNIINIVGSKQITMADFNVEPPTAMMGTLKTGDKVVVSFNLSFRLS